MIKVMIERHVANELIEFYQKAASEVMQRAMQSPGFISGESLKNSADPGHRIVFATYRSAGDWSRWYHSKERMALIDEIRPMLDNDEKITLLEHI